MALEQNINTNTIDTIEAPNPPVYVENLFEYLPMMLLDLNQGKNLSIENVSSVLKNVYKVPSFEEDPLNPAIPQSYSLVDAIKANIDPEDHAILNEEDYIEIAKSLDEMQPGDTPLTKIEMTYDGEIELRFRKLPGNKVLLETNPVRDRKDTLTGMYERDVFERRAKRVNGFLLNNELPEHLKPISQDNPITAFFADANKLKSVNDGAGGHLAGNAYLLGISIALKAAVFGTKPMPDDIAIKMFLDTPDKNVYKKLFETISKPEFWEPFNQEYGDFNEVKANEQGGRKITKMPDAIYRYGGDEFMGFLNSNDIVGLRKRINSSVSLINEVIIRDENLNGLLPQLSLAVACAKTEGKKISFLSERPNGEFYFDPNCRFKFQSFHNLIDIMDKFMYKHKEMQKLFGDQNLKSSEIPTEWLQLLNASFIDDLRDLT